MLEIRDFAFRLFGMTIPITGNDVADPIYDFDESSSSSNYHRSEKDLAEDDSTETDINRQLDDPSPHSESDENQKESDTKKDAESSKDSNDESQQKSLLKKPDKILPCPRCKSTDTKFCYYNNYNVNQPRYFCKGCQRYWTAGGTMRNVPVGAGRRKNKSSTSSSQYYHITMSEAITTESSSSSYSGLKTHAMVLTFGSENHSSVLNPAEKKGSNVNEPDKRDLNGYVNQVPCFLLPAGYPMPFYPAPYWNGGIPFNVPFISALSPSSNFDSPLGKRSRDGEMVKHCENERSTGTNNTNVLVPKTLRIDDPNEAAKSSIWTTLGIKKNDNNKGYPLSKGGFFNRFKSAKGEAKDQKRDNSQCLTANPAAFCRSINFQESLSR